MWPFDYLVHDAGGTVRRRPSLHALAAGDDAADTIETPRFFNRKAAPARSSGGVVAVDAAVWGICNSGAGAGGGLGITFSEQINPESAYLRGVRDAVFVELADMAGLEAGRLARIAGDA
jgi:hypothetical protein